MGFCLFFLFNRKMRHTGGGCDPRGLLEEGWAGVESYRDALPSPSSLGAANQSKFLLLTSMDLVQSAPQVWGNLRGTLLSHWSEAMGGCVPAG